MLSARYSTDMERIDEIDRRELIDYYLEGERWRKNVNIPAGRGVLNWEDPNALDDWLKGNNYKHGIITGFKRWVYVRLTKDDLMDCAIVNTIFPNTSQRLGDHAITPDLQEWEPPEDKIWYEPLSQGKVDERFAVILRPACKSERDQKAKLYVEDGSGRMTCYFRALMNGNNESQMTGYLGLEPDVKSDFVTNKFSEFVTQQPHFPM